MVRVAEGVGYWLQPGAAARQLGMGDGLLTSGNSNGVLRASQLGDLKLQFFVIQPQYLNGLLTVTEWHQLEVAPNNPAVQVSIFTAGELLGQRFTRLAEQPHREGLSVRCGLLQLWANAITNLLPAPLPEPADGGKLRERFRHLVRRMPEAELSQCSLRDLAGQLNCSERHFTRLFRLEFGVPFRARQIELRLLHARQLLRDSDAKIINVAYDSGYHHLGLFNMMFKKRFGMTPGEWRQQNQRRNLPLPSRSTFPAPGTRLGILLLLLVLNLMFPARAQTDSIAVPAESGPTAPAENGAGPHFNVRAYDIKSNTLLATNILAPIFFRYTGPNVSLDDMVKAASDLQWAYCDQGYPAMSIAVAPEQITNGMVTMNVFQAAFPMILVAGKRYANAIDRAQTGSSVSATKTNLPLMAPAAANTNAVPLAANREEAGAVAEAPTPTAPVVTTNVASLAIRQSTTPASPEALAQARAALSQKMSEVDVKETDTRIHVVSTNAGPRFAVNQYLVMGNSVLPPEAIALALTNIDGNYGTNVSFDGIRASLTELSAAYRTRGYVTVSVGLPRQKLTNATVQVQVTEGRLAAINVTGNRYYSSNNVMRALPSLYTGLLLNSHVLQSELDAANANRNRQIYPVIGPGPEPGTSELTLKVKDRLPLHSRLELNNQGTPGTPNLRVNFNAQYDNLWDLEHQVGIQYSFSPEQMKGENNYVATPFDDPLIANYSGYYRLPLGGYKSVEQQVEANPGSFGYNEITHKFNLPAPTGRPELNIYASRSTSDTGVQFGAPTNVVTTPLLRIDSQTSGDNVTLNEGMGGRLSLPLPTLGAVNSTLSLGVDYKRYQQVSYNTNNFYVTIVITNSAGQPVPINQTVSTGQKPVYNTLLYLPLNVGWSGSIPDPIGTTFFNAQANFNKAGVLSGDADFGRTAYTTNARAGYITVQMGADRVQTIYQDWSVKLHADGQWANGALISNEQYAMGGSAGVRGYQDGLDYGDTGWRFTIEPQTPLFKIGMVGNEGHVEPCWVRGSVFMDYGQLYRFDDTPGLPGNLGTLHTLRFWGTGFGITANIGSHLDGRVSVAWPLIANLGSSGSAHVYFGIGGQF